MSENWNDVSVVKWAENHFKEAPTGGAWAPEGTGLIFLKLEERKWALVKGMNHPNTLEILDRIRTLMFDLGYTLNEKDVEWDEPPQTMEEAVEQEMGHKKRIADSWADVDGTKLKDMDLSSAYPEFIEMKELPLEDGNTTEMEIWAYKVTNPNTGNEVVIDPDDYHILTDDKHFMRFRDSYGRWFQCMTRNELIEIADTTQWENYPGEPTDRAVLIGKNSPYEKGEKVPPWLWGTFCSVTIDTDAFADEFRSNTPEGEEE